jgi:hypothetical protein
VKDANPPERARVNAMNTRTKTMDGTIRLYVDPAAAPHVVRDLEGVRHAQGRAPARSTRRAIAHDPPKLRRTSRSTRSATTVDIAKFRPIWVSYTRADVISWVTATVNNVETLVQVVLREGSSQRIGRYGVVPVVRYRVCHLGLLRDPDKGDTAQPELTAWWEVVEETKDDSGNVTVKRVDGPGIFRDRAGQVFDEIPLAVPSAVNSDAIFTGDPPLIDLAWANLEHWQIATERRWYNRLSAYPQPVVEGELVSDSPSSDGGQVIRPTLKLGPTTVVNLKAGSKFSYAEVSGKSAETLKQELQDKKDEMAELGASFLSKKTRGVETAEAKRIDAAAENATLSTAGQGIEDGFNEALRLHARYLAIPAEKAPTTKLNRDFEGILMDAPVMQAYAQLIGLGYPKKLVLEAFQVGGRIPDDANLDELEMQWDAALQAERDQKALEAEQARQAAEAAAANRQVA